MKVLSLFSGVGGFDMGLENAGMETVFQCEWDKHCRTILDRHWPTVPKWDDVSTLTGEHILAHAPVIDVVAWGSPCQDLSVAGKRAGLEGGRSGLFYEGMRIITELRKASNGKYPRISIWENVYGALNSNKGEDFEAILKEMVEAGSLLCEWRVLDAQYFGVPQRRRRVFVVAVFDSATANRCPDPLLPVSEGLLWHPTTGAATREEPADTTSASIGSGSQWAAGTSPDGDFLTTSVTSKWHKGSGGPSGSEHYNMVVEELPILIDRAAFNQGENAKYPPHISDDPVIPSLVARGPHAVFTKSRRAQSATDDETWVEGKPAPTLNSFDQGDVRATTAIVFENSYRDGARIANDHVTQTLSAKMGTGGGNTPMLAQEPLVFQPGTMIRLNGGVWDGVVPTLRAEAKRGDNEPHITYSIQDGREIEKNQNGLGVAGEGAPAYTIDQTGAQAIAYSIREDAKAGNFSVTELDHANSLSALRPSPQSHHAQMFIAEPTMVVRRLTPLECERLMGWPDDHTRHKADGTEQADTHRYKQCGNGVASPVAQWIGEQLINL